MYIFIQMLHLDLVVFTYVERGMLIKYIFRFILGLDHEKWSKIGQKLVLAVIKLIDQLSVLSYASKKRMYQLRVKSVERCYPYSSTRALIVHLVLIVGWRGTTRVRLAFPGAPNTTSPFK